MQRPTSSPTSKKRPISVRERVYEHLKSAILSDEFSPGERLTEEHLAEKLSVSRTPIREALHKLESEGLIKPLETRGFVASRDSKEEVEELFEIRAVLEGYVLRVICQKISHQSLEELQGFIDQAEEALRKKQIDEVFKWNTQFHDALYAVVAEKKRFYRMMMNIRKYVLRYRRDTLGYPDGGLRAVEGHRKIMMALQLRDPDLCERVMREHIQDAKEDALQFLFGKV